MNQVIAERIAVWERPAARRKDGLQRLLTGWAALGITLSEGTQLRTAGMPIGLSEVILGTWICFVVFLLLRGVPFTLGRAFMGLVGYWLLSWVLLGLGAMIAVQMQKVSTEAMHDSVAFLYLTVLIPLLCIGVRDQDTGDYHWRLARMFFLFNAGSAGLLLAIALVAPEVGPITFWYGPRLRGWSENPNQLAIAMAAMPFLGWLLWRRSSSWFGKLGCALGIAVCIAAGIATQSDGLRAAWVASFGAAGGLAFWRVTMRGRSRWLFITHAIVPAVIVIIGVFYGGAVVEQLTRVGEGVYDEGGQGDTRVTAWENGLRAISVSPLVGFGPGAYSGMLGPFGKFRSSQHADRLGHEHRHHRHRSAPRAVGLVPLAGATMQVPCVLGYDGRDHRSRHVRLPVAASRLLDHSGACPHPEGKSLGRKTPTGRRAADLAFGGIQSAARN